MGQAERTQSTHFDFNLGHNLAEIHQNERPSWRQSPSKLNTSCRTWLEIKWAHLRSSENLLPEGNHLLLREMLFPPVFLLYPCWLLETDKSGSMHKMQRNWSRCGNVSKDLSRERYGLFPATLYHKLYLIYYLLFICYSDPWSRFWMLAFLPFLWMCIAQISSGDYFFLQLPIRSVIFFRLNLNI